MDLKQQALSGIKWSTFGSVINTVVSLVQLVILTRLLNPTDFGLIALVMVVIGFSQMFIDMGISNAIIHKQDLTVNQLSSLYWLNVLMGPVLFLLLFFLTPFIASFYKEPRLIDLIRIVSLTFLFQPFGQQFMVLLQKNMEFNKIAKAQVFSRICSFILIISLAYVGYGVLSLAIGTVIYSLFSTIAFISYGSRFYWPKLYFKKSDLNTFLSFGLFQMGEKMINYFNSQFDTILVGKFLGTEILGLYNIAKSLATYPGQLINPIIIKVTFPLLSKINRDTKKLKSVYLKTISYLSYVNFPVYTLLVLLAKPIVLIFFGPKWIDAVLLIQIMSLTFMLRSVGNPVGSLLLSKGRADIAFYWNLVSLIIVPGSIYLGSLWGATGIVSIALIREMVLVIPAWKIIIKKLIHANFLEYSKSIINPLILVLFSGIITIAPLYFVKETSLDLMIGVLVFTISYILLLKKYQTEFYSEIRSLIFSVPSSLVLSFWNIYGRIIKFIF